jgi:hypothetical protein
MIRRGAAERHHLPVARRPRSGGLAHKTKREALRCVQLGRLAGCASRAMTSPPGVRVWAGSPAAQGRCASLRVTGDRLRRPLRCGRPSAPGRPRQVGEEQRGSFPIWHRTKVMLISSMRECQATRRGRRSSRPCPDGTRSFPRSGERAHAGRRPRPGQLPARRAVARSPAACSSATGCRPR